MATPVEDVRFPPARGGQGLSLPFPLTGGDFFRQERITYEIALSSAGDRALSLTEALRHERDEVERLNARIEQCRAEEERQAREAEEVRRELDRICETATWRSRQWLLNRGWLARAYRALRRAPR